MQFRHAALACAALFALSAPVAAVPVFVGTQSAAGVGVRFVKIDLQDPNTQLDVLLANKAPRANTMQETSGDEPFAAMVGRARAAAVINGTFFSKNAMKTVMGNMVRGGQFVKYSQWENYGTTFGLRSGNVPEMITARAQGKPDWQNHWFSVTCGPRLLMNGNVSLHPVEEGFSDPHVLNAGGRSALGYTRDGRWLYLVSFTQAVTLAQEAASMKALGLWEAMNLDGGASQALAVAGKVVVPAGRNLTNVIAVYDKKFPAPAPLVDAYRGYLAAHPVVAATPGAGPAVGAADRFVQRLKPGEIIDYGGLKFSHVLRDPIVGIRSGILAFSDKSYGQVFARWSQPRPTYTLEFEARLVDDYFAVYFDGRRAGNQVQGLAVEYRAASPAGLYLRRDGEAIYYDQGLAIDKDWHKFRAVVGANRVEVYMDGVGRTLLEGERTGSGDGIGLAGRGEFRNIRVIDSADLGAAPEQEHSSEPPPEANTPEPTEEW